MRRFFLLFLLLSGSLLFSQKGKSKTKEKEKHRDKNSGSIFKDHTPYARDFHSVGHSLFFDLNLAPLTSYKVNDTLNSYSRLAEYSFYHISYFFRLNLIQPSDERAITLALNPGIGLGQTASKNIGGFGMVSLGALLGWETGAGSTYMSGEDRGGFFRLGAEYTYMPLITGKKTAGEHDIRSWISPIVSFGFRKENRKQNLIETNFKVGWGFPRQNDLTATNSFTFARPFTFRMSFVVFLDH